MKKAVRYIVQGTVQGVFFRQFVKENADDLDLKGFVRNLANGDVEVNVEGDDLKIDKFAKIIAKGPPHASIKNVQMEEKRWSGEFKEFKVLRF